MKTNLTKDSIGYQIVQEYYNTPATIDPEHIDDIIFVVGRVDEEGAIKYFSDLREAFKNMPEYTISRISLSVDNKYPNLTPEQKTDRIWYRFRSRIINACWDKNPTHKAYGYYWFMKLQHANQQD